MQKGMLLVISKVQSGCMVDKLHSSVFCRGLCVESTLVCITHSEWLDMIQDVNDLDEPTILCNFSVFAES